MNQNYRGGGGNVNQNMNRDFSSQSQNQFQNMNPKMQSDRSGPLGPGSASAGDPLRKAVVMNNGGSGQGGNPKGPTNTNLFGGTK